MPAEISELTFGAAMMFTNKQLLEACQKDKKTGGYGAFFSFVSKDFAAVCNGKSSPIVAETAAKKKEYTSRMDMSSKYLNDVIKGISAAIALRKDPVFKENTKGSPDSWIPDVVYLTGDKWPKDIEKFAVSAYGWSGYNSADVILKKGNHYYGVSLKKKPSYNDMDPTIINKVFDSVLNKELISETYSYSSAPKPKRTAKKNSDALMNDAATFAEIKEKLDAAKAKYFAGLVWQAGQQGILDVNDIPELKGMTSPPTDPTKIKALYEAKARNRKLFPDTYISTKLCKNSDPQDRVTPRGTPYDTDKKPPLSKKGTMRYFVNNELGKENNPLWNQYVGIMNQYASVFGNALINLVLKTKLYDKLSAQDIKGAPFSFFLVTGTGTINLDRKTPAKSTINLGTGSSISLHTVLCGLAHIEKVYANVPYEVVINETKMRESLNNSRRNKESDPEDEASGAAKVFMQLKRGSKRGGITVLNIELRYKGKFNPQPQFFATIDNQYKNLLDQNCSGTGKRKTHA